MRGDKLAVVKLKAKDNFSEVLVEKNKQTNEKQTNNQKTPNTVGLLQGP